MALGITNDEFFEHAGHDGGEIIFPEVDDPFCRRGFHISEAVVVAIKLGFTATPVELNPCIVANGAEGAYPVVYGRSKLSQTNDAVFKAIIDQSKGVIECTTRLRNWHAVAFSKGVIFDPDGRVFEYTPAACEVRNLFTFRLWSIQKATA